MNEELNSQNTFSMLLEEVWSESGGRDNLASAIGIDPSLLTRFKNDENGLKISSLDRMFEVAGVVVMPRRKVERLKDLIVGAVQMYDEEKMRNTLLSKKKPLNCATN